MNKAIMFYVSASLLGFSYLWAYLDKPLVESPKSGFKIEYMDPKTADVHEAFVPLKVRFDESDGGKKPQEYLDRAEDTYADPYIGGRYSDGTNYRD